jgi:hypothetical protein
MERLDTSKVYGIIDSQIDVGGWPVLNSLPAPMDTDHDGMPDSWESSNGLNPSDGADRNMVGVDGYTMLEKYLNSLVGTNPGTTGVSAHVSDVPHEFMLFQNYPNPFNPATAISYQLLAYDFVNLKVYDVLGREVAILVNAEQSPGRYQVMFDARGLMSGVYFYQLRAGSFADTKKLVLVK